MDDIELDINEFSDEKLVNGLDATGEVVDLAKAYLTSLKKFEPLTKQEERKLFIEYYESHNPKIKKEIIERNLRFVVWFIRKNNIKIDGMDFMDLVQEGNYVLMKAFEKFDIDQNTKFITFLGECLKGYFKNCKFENAHFMKIGHNMYGAYLKYLKYKNEYVKENRKEPSEREVMGTLHISKTTYDSFKNMEIMGNTTVSLDSTVNRDDDKERPLYDLIADGNNEIDNFEEFINNKILRWSVKEALTPLEYYLFYNYITGPNTFTQTKLANIIGMSQISVCRILKSIFEKVKSINLDQIKISIELMKKIEKMDFRPSDFPKKVILIYMRDKMSAEEFYYIYNVWYLKYDDETLRRKFKKIGVNYDELRVSMQSIMDTLEEMLEFKYTKIFNVVKKKYSNPQIMEMDISVRMNFDYVISHILNKLTYDEVIDILGENYDSLDEEIKRGLYTYYNWKYKWKNVTVKEDIEAKINLKRHGFKRKRHVDLDKLYDVYLKNEDMFEDATKEAIESTLFSKYTNKKSKFNSTIRSAYYRSLWRLEEKYYNLDNYFSLDIPKGEYYRILREYRYIFTEEELFVLDAHSEYKKKRATFEEMASSLGKSVNEVDGIYLWAKNKILLLYLGLYKVMVIENEPLYVQYVNNPKFDITPLAREIGRMRFIEHLSYEEIADRVKLEDDEENRQKKSKTSKKQKVSNIITKLARSIEIHHYNILNEVKFDEDKVNLLLDELNYSDGDKNIIRDYYIDEINMDNLKSKYNMSQSEINTVMMKFKHNYIAKYKKDVNPDDIERELMEHVTDTVLTEDQRLVLAFMQGIKCPYNPLGKKKEASEIALMIDTNEKNVATIYRKGVFNIGAKLAGIIGSDLGALSRNEIIKALEDKNIPLTEEEKILIRQFKGIDEETKTLDELGIINKVNATSIKRRIQNIYLSILKYQDGKTDKKYDFNEDIVPVLKYLPLYYQNLVIDMYRDNLNNKELALKYGIDYERIHLETAEVNKQLFYLLKCPRAKKFDFDYAREVINNPDLPYYDSETIDVVYIFNRLFGNDGNKPATKKEIQECLGLSSSVKINVILRKMMIAICKYKDGFKKAKSYTREEIENYYNTYKDELTDFDKKRFFHALRDEAQIYKGVNDLVLYEMLKSESDDILFLDELGRDKIRDMMRYNPYNLTGAQLAYLAFAYGIPAKELMNGRKRRKLYRALVPFMKDYILGEIKRLEKEE